MEQSWRPAVAAGGAGSHGTTWTSPSSGPYPWPALANVSLQAVDFRTFWGEKSELRRFQDGTICEAVVWEASTVCQKRLIPEQIVRHLLKL